MIRARCLIAVGVLSACSGAPPRSGPVCGSRVGDGPGEVDGGGGPVVARLDQPVMVALLATAAPGCDGDSDVQLAIEVLDPLNRPVPHSLKRLAFIPGLVVERFLAEVVFTPTMPGRHHVSVRFDPAMGTAQAQVEAVALASAPRRVELDMRCADVEELPSGLLLCSSLINPGALVAFNDAGPLPDEARAGPFVVAGPVIWTLGNGAIRRYLDDGNPFADAGLSFPLPTVGWGGLVASEDSAAFVGSSGFVRVGLDAGTLVVAAQQSWSIEMGSDFRATLDESEQALLFGYMQISSAFRNFACWTRLDGSTQLSCTEMTSGSRWIGSDATGLWLQRDTEIQHVGLALRDGGLSPVVTARPLKVPRIYQAGPFHYENPPVLATPGYPSIARFRNGEIVLDGFDLPKDFVLKGARTIDWAQDKRGTLLLYDR